MLTLATVANAKQRTPFERDTNMTTRKTKPTTKKAATKPAKKTATTKTAEKKMSQLDAAMAVLKKARKPMNCIEMVNAMTEQKLWSSPGGKTPHATLYASILRDLRNGNDARFKKVDRGQFTLAGK